MESTDVLRSTSHFLSLPREVRDNIYECLFADGKQVHIRHFGASFVVWYHSKYASDDDIDGWNGWALDRLPFQKWLLVNKQILSEGLQTFQRRAEWINAESTAIRAPGLLNLRSTLLNQFNAQYLTVEYRLIHNGLTRIWIPEMGARYYQMVRVVNPFRFIPLGNPTRRHLDGIFLRRLDIVLRPDWETVIQVLNREADEEAKRELSFVHQNLDYLRDLGQICELGVTVLHARGYLGPLHAEVVRQGILGLGERIMRARNPEPVVVEEEVWDVDDGKNCGERYLFHRRP